MKSKLAVSLLGLICSAASIPALAATVYSSGAPNFTVTAETVGPYMGNQLDITDKFVLTSTTTINAATFSYWDSDGDSLQSVTWSLGTSQYGSQKGTGTSAATFTDAGLNAANYDEDTASFDLTTVTLGPGTYYFTIDNVVTSDGGPVFWDVNNGSSNGYGNYAGSVGDDECNLGNCGLSGGETFTLDDNPPALTPEPSSFLLLGSGLAGLAGMLRRKLKA